MGVRGWGGEGGGVAVLYIRLLQGPGHAASYNPAAHVCTVYTMPVSILTLTSNIKKKKITKSNSQETNCTGGALRIV